MRSYLEILKELAQTINTDECIPESERTEIITHTNKLFDLLWKYSD